MKTSNKKLLQHQLSACLTTGQRQLNKGMSRRSTAWRVVFTLVLQRKGLLWRVRAFVYLFIYTCPFAFCTQTYQLMQSGIFNREPLEPKLRQRLWITFCIFRSCKNVTFSAIRSLRLHLPLYQFRSAGFLEVLCKAAESNGYISLLGGRRVAVFLKTVGRNKLQFIGWIHVQVGFQDCNTGLI